MKRRKKSKIIKQRKGNRKTKNQDESCVIKIYLQSNIKI